LSIQFAPRASHNVIGITTARLPACRGLLARAAAVGDACEARDYVAVFRPLLALRRLLAVQGMVYLQRRGVCGESTASLQCERHHIHAMSPQQASNRCNTVHHRLLNRSRGKTLVTWHIRPHLMQWCVASSWQRSPSVSMSSHCICAGISADIHFSMSPAASTDPRLPQTSAAAADDQCLRRERRSEADTQVRTTMHAQGVDAGFPARVAHALRN